MKAKHVKQHTTDPEIIQDYDVWGDVIYIVKNKKYTSKDEALKAANRLIDEEFKQRYLKDKTK